MNDNERERVGRAVRAEWDAWGERGGIVSVMPPVPWEQLAESTRRFFCDAGEAAIAEYVRIVAAEWRAGAGHAPAAGPAPLPPVLLARWGDREPEGGAS